MAGRIRKYLILLVFIAALLAVGWKVYSIQQAQNQAVRRPMGQGRLVGVTAASPRLGMVREELLLTGALKPRQQVDITAKVTGRVEAVPFQIGDTVRKGDLLAELEDEELRQQVTRAEAAIEVSRASYAQRIAERDNAEAELARSTELVEEGLVSRQDFESRKTGLAVTNAQMKLAEAQIHQAEAELRELRIRLEQSRVHAPMNGVVAVRYVDVGALVSPSMPILQMVDLSTMKTQANVPEASLQQLRVGNSTVVHVDAMPGQEFRGRVSRISPVLDPATRTALVEIDVPNPERILKAEMFARIQLDSGIDRPALLIPREALVYRGQQPGVFIITGDQPIFQAVETGEQQGDDVEVLGNLDPDVQIAGKGANMLNRGDRVRIVENPEEVADNAAPVSLEDPAAGSSEPAEKNPAASSSSQRQRRGASPTERN